jgi:hypothetical protein
MTLPEKKPRLSAEEEQRRLDIFDAIILKHPRIGEIEEAVTSLMTQTEAVVAGNERRREEADGRSYMIKELWVLPIIGPSGSTKSTSMMQVIAKINANPKYAKGDIPILFVKMDANVRGARQFQMRILEAYGDAAQDVMLSVTDKWGASGINRAIGNIARQLKTTVIVLDETHSVLVHDAGKIAPQMSKAIQGLANDGIFSVVMIGTDDMKRLFKVNKELHNRVEAGSEVSLAAYDIKKVEDRAYFFSFVDRLEKRMVKDGVIDESIGLTDNIKGRAIAHDMAGGIIGVVSRLLRSTVIRAFRKGRTSITIEDLADVFQAWNNIQEKPGFNPFIDGPDKKTYQHALLDLPKTAKKAS